MTPALPVDEPQLPPAPSLFRQDWPDLARGIGIVLVVIGHVWRGLMATGLPIDPGLFAAVDGLIYAFHMPLFSFS